MKKFMSIIAVSIPLFQIKNRHNLLCRYLSSVNFNITPKETP